MSMGSDMYTFINGYDLKYLGEVGNAKYFMGANNRTYRYHSNGLTQPEVKLAHETLEGRAIWRALPDGPLAHAIRASAARVQ